MWPGGDRTAATGRVFMCELRQEAASGRFTTAFGVYHDAYARVDGRNVMEIRLHRTRN